MWKSVPERSCVRAALWILLLTTDATSETPYCTFNFTFPDLNSRTLTVEINTIISVAFRLETTLEGCDLPENFEITVRRKEKREFQYVCKILHINGRCKTSVEHVKQRTCECLAEDGRYQLSIRVEENGYGTWALSIKPDISSEAIINVIRSQSAISIISSDVPRSSNGDADTGYTEPQLYLTDDREGVSGYIQTTTPLATTNDITNETSASQQELNLTVVITAAIAAVALTLISFRILSVIRDSILARKSRVSRNLDIEVRSSPSDEIPRPDNHGDNGADPSCETSYYWEIPDETPSASPDPPKACLSPAVPDNYLRPSVSPEVKEGTDDTTKVTPFYENSVVRSVMEAQAVTNSPILCGREKSLDEARAASSGYIEMSRPVNKSVSDKTQPQGEHVNVSHKKTTRK